MAAKALLSKPPAKAPASRADQIARQQAEAANRAAKKSAAGQKYTGLNPDQNALVNQQTSRDLNLSGQATDMLGQVQNSFSQPFDWSKLPKLPGQGDFNNWRDQQIQQGNQAFDARMNPVFQKENEDFEQQMANRGIPMGSELYNKQKAQLQQSHNDAIQQGYYQNAQQAGQNAQQFFGIGESAYNDAYGQAQAQRNMPLADYNQLQAAQSPFGAQALQYSQTLGSQNNQATNAIRAAQQSPHGGGGGGGGGGGLGGYANTGMSFQDYLNAQNQSKLALQQGLNALNPQQKPPSYAAQLGGGLLGLGGMALGGYLFS